MIREVMQAPVSSVDVRRLPTNIAVHFRTLGTGSLSFWLYPDDREAAVLFAKQLRHAADELEVLAIATEHGLDLAVGDAEAEVDCG